MTLPQAIARARAIESDLAAGRLTRPWPADVARDLKACWAIFNRYATTKARAEEVMRGLAGQQGELEPTP